MLSHRLYTLSLILILSQTLLFAQSFNIKLDTGDSIRFSPTSRFYYDGANYFEDKTELSNGTALTDLRLGMKASFQKWEIKVDVGFANNKVSAKDVFLQYNLNNHSFLRAGNFAEPIGIENRESSANLKFMTPNSSSTAFLPGRKLGVEYAGWNEFVWVGAGLFGDSKAINNSSEGDDGYSATGRLIFTPFKGKGDILHLGIAGSYSKADANGYDYETGKKRPREVMYASGILTKVEKRKFIQASINDAKHQRKLSTELIAATKRFHIQSEYFYNHVERLNDLPYYKAHGLYAQIGFLALGDKNYSYATSIAKLKRPQPKTLEFALRCGYTNLNHNYSNIRGGEMSDVSLAANYYLNRFITFRLNYSRVKLGSHTPIANNQLISIIQGRLQVVF